MSCVSAIIGLSSFPSSIFPVTATPGPSVVFSRHCVPPQRLVSRISEQTTGYFFLPSPTWEAALPQVQSGQSFANREEAFARTFPLSP